MASPVFYIDFTRDREPDGFQRRQFFLHWWVESGLGRRGDQAGWRGQCFFANAQPLIRRLRKEGQRVVLGNPAREAA